ncbi:flagellar hook protein FlgE [Chitinimonas lacunae]|uniref:Flagellar hook protein FlgE n=1 Tax=Chitinimonas lacunae TaxID=1963018 RepID=A0ABV8MJF0_9NEIS
MAFQQGLSGLNSASKFLDVIGNNVANANTVGYKGSRAEFSDIYANTLASSKLQTGIGGRAYSVSQQFTQGPITTTNNPLDVAIGGNGFFRLLDQSGSVSYGRNGQFQLDRSGYIVNGGLRLAGYMANENGQLLSGSTPEALRIQTQNIGARATGGSSLADAGLKLAMNLDARSAIINRGTNQVSINGAVLNPGTPLGPHTLRVTDSAGQFHVLEVTAEEASPGTHLWNVKATLDGKPLPDKQLKFDANSGAIVSGSPVAYSTTVSVAGVDKAIPMDFRISFGGVKESTTLPASNGTVKIDDESAKNTRLLYPGVNLDASTPIATDPAAPDPLSQQALSTVTVLDPSGASHTVDVTLTKIGANGWQAAVSLDGAPLTLPDPQPVLTFNDKGQIIDGMEYAISDTVTQITGFSFKLDFHGMTQKAEAFSQTTPPYARATPGITPSDPSTYTSSTSATVYDSQGVPHTLTFYMTKVAPNTWEIQTSFDGAAPITQPTYMQFDETGKLINGDELAFAGDLVGKDGAVDPLAFTTFFTGSTQYGSTFGVNELTQDGYADGSITGLSIGPDGIIQGRYSNGQNRTIGQIVLFNFANSQGLQPLGDNRWAETFGSNQARAGVPGSADFGALQAGSLEDANIDLTKELVDMISAQRSYQANAQTIRTQDQLMQTLVNLR